MSRIELHAALGFIFQRASRCYMLPVVLNRQESCAQRM